MSHISLASFLKDLGGDEDAGAGPGPGPGPELGDGLDDLLEGRGSAGAGPAIVDQPGALDRAYQRGIEEGRREAEARMAHEVGEARAAGERRLEEARKSWVQEEGQRLSEELLAAVRDMHRHLADKMAEALLPIIADELRREAVSKIARAVKESEPGDWHGPVVVRAPADLLDAVRQHLEGMATLVDYRQSEGKEIEVALDKTVLTTQLESWSAVVGRLLK